MDPPDARHTDAPPARSRLRDPVPAIAACLALALFVARTPPVPGIGDSGEFTLALAFTGIPHPTGYPLYVLFGSAFVHALHALGVSFVRAAGLWSALGAAVAIGAVTALSRRLSSGRVAPALIPAALLAFNPVWLSAATIAEVYSWACAWVAAAGLYALVRARAHAAGGASASRTALGWGLLGGVGLAHHLTSVVFLAPLSLALLAALRRARAWRASLVLLAAGAALVPIASYGFLAWRAAHPAPVQWPLGPTLADLVRHATGRAYAAYVGGFAPNPLQRAMLVSGIVPWIVPGLVLAALQALRTPEAGARHTLLALVGGAALLVALAVNYRVPDPAYFFLPALLVALLATVPLADALFARAGTRPALATAAVVVVAVAVWGLAGSARERARLERVDARIRGAWAEIPPGPAIVLWDDDHVSRLEVFQSLEGSRPDLVIANPSLLTWKAARAAFERRTGIDPLAGIVPRTRADVARIPASVRRQAAVPVIEFQNVLR